MLTLLLLAALFFLVYALTGGPLPEQSTVRSIAVRFAVPAASAAGCFFLVTLLFSPLAGVPWAALGWFLPSWIVQFVDGRRTARHRALARDFVASAAGLFSAGQPAPEVIRVMGKNFAEPFGEEFREITRQHSLNQSYSFPRSFRYLAVKYRLPEFEAVAAIIEAASPAGGPKAVGGGLAKLGQALRQRERLLAERAKSLVEVKFAGYVVIVILLAGLAADATAFRHYYADGVGRLAVAIASVIVVGLIFAMRKLTQNKDLEGAV